MAGREAQHPKPLTAYLLGTGPRLPDFDWSTMPDDAHVCSINCAGLLAPRVDSMVFCDKPDRMTIDYGPDAKLLMSNPTVRKVSWREPLPKWVHPVQHVPRLGGPAADKEARRRRRTPVDGERPLFYLNGLTAAYALCWLISEGFREIVLVGHDLDPDNKTRHFWEKSRPQGHSSARALQDHLATMRSLWPQAREAGIKVFVVPPSRLLEFMPCNKTHSLTTKLSTPTSS